MGDKQTGPATPLWVANVGNTNVRLARFDGGAIAWERRVPTAEALELADDVPIGAAIALVSVVPEAAAELVAAWGDRRLFVVTAAALPALRVAYRPPGTLGADRLCNAIGLLARGAFGVAVDCGTATTLTVVDESGVVRGGAIMPGLATARDSLASATAQLPAVPLEAAIGPWGEDTQGSLQVGLVHGQVGAIAHLVARARAALPAGSRVLLTGGWSGLLAPLLPDDYELAPDLTLEGARAAYSSQ